MGSVSIWHWLVCLAVLLLMFGGRKQISDLLSEVLSVMNALRRDPPIAAAMLAFVVFAVVFVVGAIARS
jgi:hypothetical protein